MHEKLMAAISLGGYGLAPMLGRIATAWARGEITDEERGGLEEAARDRARPEDSYAPPAARLAALEGAVAALGARLDALEGGGAGEGGGGGWPDYVQPTCAEDAYRIGDRVAWGGRRWVCAYDGAVWTPAEYPAAWAEWAGPEEGAPGAEDGGDA